MIGYIYDDYGQTEATGEIGFYNEICYTGGIYDKSTGLYYLNARYYNPEDGRFITQDTERGDKKDPTSLVLYQYCASNPINYMDPSGHWKIPKWGKKLLIGTALIAGAVALTIATGGVGTIGCFAIGALYGSVSGAAIGAASGAVIGAIGHRIKTGKWKGSGKAALNGAADGYMWGAITGFVSGGLASKVCFVVGTSILAASGHVAIEKIKAGDQVYSENPETGEKGLKKVVQTFVNEVE